MINYFPTVSGSSTNLVWLHAVVKAACCHSWNCSLWLTKLKQVLS